MNRLLQFLIITIILAFASCANRGSGPKGGPKDITPPNFLGSEPSNRQLQVTSKEIELEFDEFITLEKPGEKIIISPPQAIPPIIRAASKKILVTLEDSLQENTTYSIDFTNSIVDITEQNPIQGFTYSFSTGNNIDSLQIGGIVLNARDLNPLSNMIVGIYDNLNDTAFTTTKPLRIARTNDEGRFSIKSVKAGKYHIYALKDLNRDYTYNDPNEELAFYGDIVTPSVSSILIPDTSYYVDSLASDSIKKDLIKTVYLPDSLLLLAFKKKVEKQFFIKGERKNPYKLSFFFNAPNKKAPLITPLNFLKNKLDLTQTSMHGDSVHYWLTDAASFQKDTLEVSIEYEKKDSNGNITNQIDTVSLKFKETKEKKKKTQKSPSNILILNSNIKRLIEIYTQPRFKFDVPIQLVDSTLIHLFYKKDTIWIETAINVKKIDALGFEYGFNIKWDTEKEYKLDIDSAAFISKYNTHNLASSISFNVKALDQYAMLIVTLTNKPKNAIVELLNIKDVVVRNSQAIDGEAIFEHIKPEEYFIRLFIDENNNGAWDAGDYNKNKQAEKVYYFNGALNLRANWDVEQEWDINKISLSKQKPLMLIPKAK